MTALENFASPALTRALGWTLLHSLWQGVLVAAVLAGALLLLRRQRAEVRYVASAGALGVMVALAGITFGLYFRAGVGQAGSGALSPNTVKTLRTAPLKQFEKAAVAPAAASPGHAAAAASTAMPATNPGRPSAVGLWDANTHRTAPTWLATGLRYFDTHMPLLVVGWLLGLLAMSLRLLGGLLYVQRLRSHRVRPLSAAWQERLASLAARSGVRRPVALLESALVQVPLVVGHVRPVILLPLGVMAGLSVAHLEAILAHELAHVLRRDYLVNLLQTVAEALFFYHPAVWFVANCVRTERENCCDDAAAALCGGDSLRLARALTALAEWSQSALVPAAPRLALAAINGRGALLNRVRRLVQRRPAAPTLAEGAMAAALVLGGLGLLGGSVAWAGSLSRPLAGVKPAVPAAFDWQAGERQAAFQPAAADTTKKPAGGTQARPANATAAALVSGAAPAVAAGKARETPAADKASPALQTASGDTIYRRASRTRTLADRSRRVVVDGREMAPPASDGSTVVVTKDKKGRLTDLVVNGQRIETASGWTKTKFTPKGNGKDDSRVEIIEVDPAYAPRAETFVYRGGAGATAYARAFPRVYALPTPALATRIYSEITPSDRTVLRRLGLAAPSSFSRVERLNGTYRLQSLGAAIAGPGSDVGDARSALRAAEQALREASTVKNLSAEQRKRINTRLKDVQSQLRRLDSSRPLRLGGAVVVPAAGLDGAPAYGLRNEVLPEREAGLRAGRDELRARQQELQARQEELRERMRETEGERREERLGAVERHHSAAEDAIVDELLRDGLINDRNNFQFQLKAGELRIDNKVQPKKVLDKYVKLYEANSGRKLSATSSFLMTRNGDVSDTPRDPRPPRPPRAPRAPRVPAPESMMAPPAPPAPMGAPGLPPPPPAPVDSGALREELRKDGLIGENDKSFSLELNRSGFSVNGKKQSDQLAAKYRKLVGAREGSTYNMNINLD